MTLRGVPEVNTEKCIGCGACAHACPADALRIVYEPGYVGLELNLLRCIRCGMCVENCPVGALSISTRQSVLAKAREDLKYTWRITVQRCESCSTELRVSTRAVQEAQKRLEHILRTNLCELCKARSSITE